MPFNLFFSFRPHSCHYFQGFSLSLCFRSLVIFWHGFLLCLSTVFGSLSFLNMQLYVFCQFGEIVSHYFFKKFSAPPSFCFFLCNSRDTMRPFVTVSQVPKALVIVFSLCSLLFILGNFYCSVFKFTDSFFCALHYVVKSTH